MSDRSRHIADIIVYTETWEEHRAALEELFCRRSDARLTARPTKCVIGAESFDVVGHQISDGIKGLHEDNVKKIRDAKRLQTKKEVKAFFRTYWLLSRICPELRGESGTTVRPN